MSCLNNATYNNYVTHPLKSRAGSEPMKRAHLEFHLMRAVLEIELKAHLSLNLQVLKQNTSVYNMMEKLFQLMGHRADLQSQPLSTDRQGEGARQTQELQTRPLLTRLRSAPGLPWQYCDVTAEGKPRGPFLF